MYRYERSGRSWRVYRGDEWIATVDSEREAIELIRDLTGLN